MPMSAEVGAQALDGPPPSPQQGGAGPTGQTPFSMAGLAPPPTPPPPEIMSGVQQVIVKAGDALTSVVSALQATPELAQELTLVITQLQSLTAKVMMAGAGPTSPTATGSQFPAAFDRGIAGSGTV